MGLPIIGDFMVSGKTRGKHLLFTCISQRTPGYSFPKQKNYPKINFCSKLRKKVFPGFFHSIDIMRPPLVTATVLFARREILPKT